jgi:hypothetical protein
MKYLFLLLILSSNILAQSFQSPTNPFYWKNKLGAKSEYWQQDIDYTIVAKLDEKEEIIIGGEKIMYTNNSPHVLNELFFNLYQNAFIKNSYLSNLQEANGETIKYGKWESEGKGNEILSITVDGQKVKTEIDGSIMKVFLNTPIQPNSKINIELEFKTYYSKGGVTRRRMKSYTFQKEKHFNGAHWYPRLAVYDRKFGWCTDQHLNREFYGDFGNYNVSLDMPANFVVEATGVLQNRKEVLPDTLRQKLELSNYWKHPYDTAVTYFIPMKKGERKVWKYLGENVHDFAWIAGPHYRIDEKNYKGYQTVALVLEPHASGWKNACDFTHKVIDVYSRDFGQYAYPKMVVADCQDGMEYPMLTMDGGADPGYRGLLAHEVGHNWFYGMVNNNETYRAMLDEGFTQFLTVWALEAIDGKNIFQATPTNPYLKKHYEEARVREGRAYGSFMMDAMNHDHTEINVHSDGFGGATGQGGGYRNVYNKTATMLFNLQYTLGDSLFSAAMKNYFNQWSFRHPYIEDFRSSMIEFTKVDLNWFFDEWIETSKVIDYKIFPLKKLAYNTYELKLQRKQDMQMPLDITVKGLSGKSYNFYVPNTWFEKKTDAKILPRWIGWDNKLKTEYTTKITLPEEPKLAMIDTSDRLADINELNNTTKFPWKFKFDSKTDRPRDRQNYTVLVRPDVWYNNFDGVKVGTHFEGSLNKTHHNTVLDIWLNTGLGKWSVRNAPNTAAINAFNDPVSVRFSYQSPTNLFIRNSRVRIEARHLDGVALGSFKFTKIASDYLQFNIGAKSMLRYRNEQDNYNYVTYMQWNTWQMMNNSIYGELVYYKPFSSKIQQMTSLKLRSSILSVADYSYAELEHKENIIAHRFHIKMRLFGRLGASNNYYIPTETLLNAGGASGEEMLENKYMRSVTMFPDLFNKTNSLNSPPSMSNIHYGGGINMRGYTFTPYLRNTDGVWYQTYNMNSGAAINSQINFEKYSPVKFRKLAQTIDIGTYLFGDVGSVSNFDLSYFKLSKAPFLMDAGAGVSVSMKRFWLLSGIKPLTFRFDMPIYLSHPYLNENNEQFKFRWIIGVDQAF